MKKCISLILCLVMLFGCMTVTAFASGEMYSVETNSTTVKAGDTVTYKVYLNDCSGISDGVKNFEFKLNIPDGLTFVSGDIASDFATKTGFSNPTFNSTALKASSFGTMGSNVYKGGKVEVMSFTCTVDSDAKGSLTVSLNDAKYTVGTTSNSATVAPATVTVPVHATGITFDKSSLNLSMKGGANSGKITATVLPADATDEVKWSVSPKGQKIVEISPNGKECTVMAKAPGTVTITATVNGKSASCTVTVSACDHKSDADHHHAEVPATCTTTGTKEYWECTECGMKFADEDCKTVLNDLTIAKVPHQFTKADPKDDALKTAGTCSAPAVYYYSCASCGEVEKKDSHTFNGDDSTKNPNNHTNVEMQHNDKQHWGYCKDCKANIDKQDHFSNKPANKATCTKQAICDLCNEKYGDLAPHDLKKTDKVEPTCTATGCKEYWTCNVCKGIFADDQGKTPTTLENLTINKIDHDYDVAISSTEHWKFCKVCGFVSAKEAHTYDETTGKCICGAVKNPVVSDDHKDKHTEDDKSGWHYDANSHWKLCGEANCAGHLEEAKHSFTKKSTITDGGKKYDVMECACGYVTRVEVKNTTGGTTTGTNPNAKNPYEKNDTTKKDDGKKVESGKTFDAGIALYVGLSVLSVTGGALVIGKKKEF